MCTRQNLHEQKKKTTTTGRVGFVRSPPRVPAIRATKTHWKLEPQPQAQVHLEHFLSELWAIPRPTGMRRRRSSVKLTPRPRPPVEQPPTVRPGTPVLKDTSRAASCPRYSCFVLPAALVTATTLLATPALLLKRLDPWQRDQFTLDDDLQRSLNYSVHPCDDFYQHVCSHWDRDVYRGYWSPAQKYEHLFHGQVIKRHLLRHIPKNPVSARDKASALLLKCLSREVKGGRSFQKLGFADLTWWSLLVRGLCSRRYLLEGYDAKHRQDNSILQLSLSMTSISGDPCFKAPTLLPCPAPSEQQPNELHVAAPKVDDHSGSSIASSSSGFGSLPRKQRPTIGNTSAGAL
ncbi:hypothetical protein HPB52_019641 [Rhipicephalus sanguineus]|uniref:Peptidase M13 N-terminal domain-containing protein n=1 Tax=Rhipicephalus sanguineus TaxID=34632 RepID=A0A9D4QE66_RHISA|nr:hypothetical protein HPB52_019641 [Rhipicephalus sanguineus]